MTMPDADTSGTDTQDPTTKPPASADKDPAAEVEKWKSLARKHEQQAKANADAAKRLAELEDQGKSEAEKLTTRLTEAEKRVASAEARALRLEVAASKGLSAAQAKRLVGTTKEELEADADEILEAFPAKSGATPPPSDRPVADLRGGTDPTTEPVEMNPAKLAESVPRL
jgi:hypothetical protein